MPVHDWSRVDAGIFHDFHHAWIEELKRALNAGVLPPDYYAMAEQHAAGFGPYVLTLQESANGPSNRLGAAVTPPVQGGSVLTKPMIEVTAETDMEFYRRKQNSLAVRHVSGDQIVAMIEVVSPGNKAGRKAIRSFVEKAADLLDKGVHLLILDLHPPGPRDPHGIHALIWDEVSGQESPPPAKPLTLASYETCSLLRAYVQTVAVGDRLPDMPLYLAERAHVPVPLEQTYQSAWSAFPRRWQSVLES